MTLVPLLVTSKVRLPAGAVVRETPQASSLAVTAIGPLSPDWGWVAPPPPQAASAVSDMTPTAPSTAVAQFLDGSGFQDTGSPLRTGCGVIGW